MHVMGFRPISSPTVASAHRSTKDVMEEMRATTEYREENPDASFEEAYLAPYDKAVTKSLKAVDEPGMRLNVALMAGLATVHPIAAAAFGTTSGLGLLALGGMEAWEGHKNKDSTMTRAGLFNSVIGASLAVTPLLPWYGRLAPLGLIGLRELWLRHEMARPTLRVPGLQPGSGRSVAPKPPATSAASNSPRALQELARLAGVGLPAGGQARTARALGNLARAGWSFQTVRGEEGYLKDVGPLEAYHYFVGDRNTNLREGERLLLRTPDHTSLDDQDTWFHVVDLDEVGAVDFFHGKGEPETVTHPELAENLKRLEAVGVEMHSPAKRYRLHSGALQAYLGYTRGRDADLFLGGIRLGAGPVPAQQVTDLGALSGLTEDQVKQFLSAMVVGASAEQALDQVQETGPAIEVSETHVKIGGVAIRKRSR